MARRSILLVIGWTVQDTPFRGFIVATAWDAAGTYLLYVDPFLNLRITKRQSDGVYIQGRLLSTRTDIGPDGSAAQGDFDQTELFQAYTVGGAYAPRERVTTNPSWDSASTLALTPGTTFPVRLVWARGGSDFGGSETDLRRALGDQDGGWVLATLATAGFLNFWPDVAMSGTTTYVTWNRDGRTVQANNASGSFLSHTFVTPAVQSQRPRIAVGPGQVAVGWTTAAVPYRAFVAERTGTSWTGAAASPSGLPRLQLLAGVAASPSGLPRLQLLAGVATTGGNATATIVSSGSQLYSATET